MNCNARGSVVSVAPSYGKPRGECGEVACCAQFGGGLPEPKGLSLENTKVFGTNEEGLCHGLLLQ